ESSVVWARQSLAALPAGDGFDVLRRDALDLGAVGSLLVARVAHEHPVFVQRMQVPLLAFVAHLAASAWRGYSAAVAFARSGEIRKVHDELRQVEPLNLIENVMFIRSRAAVPSCWRL